jgi:hypothetical protein
VSDPGAPQKHLRRTLSTVIAFAPEIAPDFRHPISAAPPHPRRTLISVNALASEIGPEFSPGIPSHRETRGFSPRDTPSQMRLNPQTCALTAAPPYPRRTLISVAAFASEIGPDFSPGIPSHRETRGFSPGTRPPKCASNPKPAPSPPHHHTTAYTHLRRLLLLLR